MHAEGCRVPRRIHRQVWRLHWQGLCSLFRASLSRADLRVVAQLFLGKDDLAVLLVKEGLAKVDEYASERKDLFDAQEEAQREKKNVGPLSISDGGFRIN